MPDILEMYPEVIKLVGGMIRGIRGARKETTSALDNRYHRNFREWIDIITYAEEKSPKVAAKKFYGISPEGRIPLSPKYIKRNIPRIKDFIDNHLVYEPVFGLNAYIISGIIGNTPELSRKYERLSEDYDKQVKNIQENQSYYGPYVYYKIIHYDRSLYNQQKRKYDSGLRQAKPDGKKECMRFRKSDFVGALFNTLVPNMKDQGALMVTKLTNWPELFANVQDRNTSNVPKGLVILLNEALSDLATILEKYKKKIA